MSTCKPLCVPISMEMKLSIKQSLTYPNEMEDMARIPYASVIGSLMYVMVYTRLGIA